MYDHLSQKSSMIEETRNMIQEIACSKVNRKFTSKGGNITASFFIDKNHIDCSKLIYNLNHLYHDCGMGFKLLSQELGNVSYTRLRTIFKALGIEHRTGTSCVTEGLKKLRSERAKKNNPWSNWTEKYPNKDNINKHHLGGWYFNKSLKKYVWLRSSWEYGFAQWLDTTNQIWDVEVRSYLLSDGRYYRPDFFIYEENKLSSIIEIKSKWFNGSLERIDKFEKFKLEYSDINSKIITEEIFDIIGRKNVDILNEWKNKRIMELPNE